MANRSETSIDFVVRLAPETPYELPDIQDSLFEALRNGGFEAARRDVSISVLFSSLRVDLIPARMRRHHPDLLEIHARGSGRSIVTDLLAHVEQAIGSGRADEVRLIKLWRDQKMLDFPSFYLELAVIAALRGAPRGQLAENVWQVLGFFEKSFVTRAFIDPANGTNIVSDELRPKERQAIAEAAATCRAGLPWSAILV